MNFDKVKALCKKAKYISLYDTEDCQWLGDDSAFYPLYEHPQYDKYTIASVLSLDEAKKNSMHYMIGDFPQQLNPNDAVKDEKPCGMFGINLNWYGESLIPLNTSEGLKVIKSKYLTPLLKEDYQFYERKTPTGQIYIAIKVGLLCEAIVIPSQNYITESLVAELYKLAESAEITISNAKKTEGK